MIFFNRLIKKFIVSNLIFQVKRNMLKNSCTNNCTPHYKKSHFLQELKATVNMIVNKSDDKFNSD